MQELTSTVTSKGQITIPAEVRQHLGLEQGDKVLFIIEDQGTVRVEVPPYSTIASLRGAAGSLEKPLSWKEMLEIAREDHVQEVIEG